MGQAKIEQGQRSIREIPTPRSISNDKVLTLEEITKTHNDLLTTFQQVLEWIEVLQEGEDSLSKEDDLQYAYTLLAACLLVDVQLIQQFGPTRVSINSPEASDVFNKITQSITLIGTTLNTQTTFE